MIEECGLNRALLSIKYWESDFNSFGDIAKQQ